MPGLGSDCEHFCPAQAELNTLFMLVSTRCLCCGRKKTRSGRVGEADEGRQQQLPEAVAMLNGPLDVVVLSSLVLAVMDVVMLPPVSLAWAEIYKKSPVRTMKVLENGGTTFF